LVALLAVDLGVRTGLALYGSDGRLRWYRSHNFGDAARLRRGVPGVLDGEPELNTVVLEGGGSLARYWTVEAHARGLALLSVSAEMWRTRFFYPRQQRTGGIAKGTADGVARRVIEWSGAKRPTSLRHDAAEAILIGLWGVLELGWLAESPLDHSRNLV
jgi:hypothetical protein